MRVPVIDDRPITYDECMRLMAELEKRDDDMQPIFAEAKDKK